MRQRDIPEFSFGDGKNKVSIKGREAIRAAGWALRLLLFARAMNMLIVLPIGSIGYLFVKWLLN